MVVWQWYCGGMEVLSKGSTDIEAPSYCQVDFPLVVEKGYTYSIPSGLLHRLRLGMRVLVPFGKKKEIGYVTDLFSHPPELPEGTEIQPVLETIDAEPIITRGVLELVRRASDYYLEPIGLFIKSALPPSLRGGNRPAELKRAIALADSLPQIKLTKRQQELVDLLQREGPLTRKELSLLGGFSSAIVKRMLEMGVIKEEERGPRFMGVFRSSVPDVVEAIELTGEQKKAVGCLVANLEERRYNTFLLHGVTGSGKTEVYIRLCARAIEMGVGSLVLVPEISLTPHYIGRFRSRFKERVALLHSGLSVAERWREWERIRRGEALVIIGTRSAVFAPVSKLGVVIVDEEHDSSYKQETRPRYNARDLAVWRGNLENATVVLGSATPSLESYNNALIKRYTLIELTKRVGEAKLPTVKVVDMRRENWPISKPLEKAIEETLNKGEKVLLLLNQRGYAPFLMCQDCGFVPQCPNCEVSFTYHRSPPLLVCHYCGHFEGPFDLCPTCRGEMKIMGIGTQRLQEEVERLFPERVVARMDKDTSKGREGSWKVLRRLERGEVDILVGTQMIAKGHHYPSITLGGVVFADVGLRLPDFRAAERTFQLLTQLAGRTGRGEKVGKVIVQSFVPYHYSIKWAKTQDFKGFAEEEMKMRKAFGFPPFIHLTRLLFSGKREDKVKRVAAEVATLLQRSPKIQVLGPAPAPLSRLRNRVRWHLFLKSGSRVAVTEALKGIPLRKHGVSIEVDRDPYSLL